MKLIDQDPRDYRAKPVKGEPIFLPGAGKKVGVHLVVWVCVAIMSLAVLWLISPLEPVIKGLVASLLN